MKKILIAISCFILTILLISCNSYEKYNIKEASEKINIKMSNLDKEEINIFLDKLDDFAAKLTIATYEDKKGDNYVISPVSIYMALAMAIECSNNNTRDEILNAVGVTYDEVVKFTSYLYSLKNREYYYYTLMENKKVLAFEQLANSIWIDENIKLKEQGLINLSEKYHADSFHVPFSSNTSSANRALSDYIKKMTNGLIKPDFDLDKETIFTLINTFYLKEVWNEDGDALSFTSEKYDFINYDSEVISTKLLKGYYSSGKAYETDTYRHFFTVTEHNYRIKFIIPKDGYSLEEIFTEETLIKINDIDNYLEVDHERKEINHTRCFFPEFKAEYDKDIKNILKSKFGIYSLFEMASCNLSNITDDDACCSAVIHKCSLNVNKHGIEGAAVTALPMAGAPGPGEYVDVYYDFIVDRAFGFMITDSSGVILFSGVINKL